MRSTVALHCDYSFGLAIRGAQGDVFYRAKLSPGPMYDKFGDPKSVAYYCKVA